VRKGFVRDVRVRVDVNGDGGRRRVGIYVRKRCEALIYMDAERDASVG